MISLPGGAFIMGSPDSEPERSSDEGPQRTVRIRPFAIGKTEVTFADYDVFAEATGRNKPNDFGWGRGQQPVVGVSWSDAVAYAEWLSAQTGQRYRLPTEAEWEYAARAGTDTPFWTGGCIHTDQANYYGQYDYNNCGAKTGVYRARTVAAGSLPANAWGLHETAGNAWEWVQDCWHDSYQGAPTDGGAWEEPGCARRVVRGGGWNNYPQKGRPVGLRFRCARCRTTSWAFVSPGIYDPVPFVLCPFVGVQGAKPPGFTIFMGGSSSCRDPKTPRRTPCKAVTTCWPG
ncbi:MAG: formylglycine-generating enzyme family protein [Candidatus Competibacteraceae bacterium]|nr:formylglycine-generating enzyme family protein [Candidatus Competibacteraceae bacterium]